VNFETKCVVFYLAGIVISAVILSIASKRRFLDELGACVFWPWLWVTIIETAISRND
jgi:hypothetical protein